MPALDPPLVAAGRDCDVFLLDERTLLRRYRGGDHDVALEARVMRFLRAAGFPVPDVLDWDHDSLILTRVAGPSMYDDMRRRRGSYREHMASLAELHAALHEIPPPPWLLRLQRVVPAVTDSPDSILHLDFHPHNILLGPSGPVVIDWSNVRAGPAGYEVAQTWLLLSTTLDLPEGGQAPPGAGRILAQHFLRSVDVDQALPYLRFVAQERLANHNISAGERRAVQEFLGTTVRRLLPLRRDTAAP